MERSAIHDKINLKKGPWTPEEDKKLIDYIQNHGHGSWRNLPRHAGLNRCGKSCRLRWTNYLRPDIKRGKFSEEEDRLIIDLHSLLGNKWSTIATRLSGRTDNEIKNYWNTHLRKKLLLMGIDPVTHRQRADLDLLASFPNLIATTNLGNLPNAWDKLQQDAAQLTRFQLLQSLIQFMVTAASPPNLNALNLFAPAALRNYQITDLLQLNYQLEGFINGSLSLPQDPIAMTAGLAPPFGIQQLANNFQVFPPTDGSCSSELSMENNGVDANQMFSSYNIPTADSTPSLVSASPKNPTADQTPEPIYSVDASAESSTSITSETWEELNLGDLDEDLCWKDILDQIKWSSDK